MARSVPWFIIMLFTTTEQDFGGRAGIELKDYDIDITIEFLASVKSIHQSVLQDKIQNGFNSQSRNRSPQCQATFKYAKLTIRQMYLKMAEATYVCCST